MTAPIIYIPHGGGPMPLLGEPNHLGLITFLSELSTKIGTPKAILIISAHWEETVATVSSSAHPTMIYDYYGFPEESYQIQYPAAGDPALAYKVVSMLEKNGISAKKNPTRGFDHGTYVPLKLIYPKADIPVVQLSLLNSLEPQSQINIGKAIGKLANDDILIVGSGLSFHNLQVIMSKAPEVLEKSQHFDTWLNEVILNESLTLLEKEKSLVNWSAAPQARYAHPREEHLLPLHVCFGASLAVNYKAVSIYDEILLGVKTSGFMWH